MNAVEIANRAFNRLVAVDEIVAALTSKEVELLETTYANDLSTAVGKILRLLLARGAVYSPGKFGTRHHYGIASVLDPTTATLPTEESRRQRVLELVRCTVAELGYAVRNADVLKYASSSLYAEDLSPEMI